MATVKVVVRVRPFNQREIDMGCQRIIEMEGKKTRIINSKIPVTNQEGDTGRERVKEFTFDYAYWSCNSKDPSFVDQEQVFLDLGSVVVDNAFEGYNACVFAYGQTGSGKTYTMMGQSDSVGLIPRICENLFDRMKRYKSEGTTYRTEVSYLEIYNEKVKDLLKQSSKHKLRVREHPRLGPYVQDLSKHLVMDYPDIRELMMKGNAIRTTAATNMNDVSSRSHAIFTITFVQAKFNVDMPSETVSKINLVDLAGSERAVATGATGQRLKEGGHINQSLVTLGKVISALADLSSPANRGRQTYIPYRDSVLTWLLKDSLGGNSKTIMIAAISPADVNYGETLSTLRYANRAKNIINKPTINEDPNVKIIRDLRAEISYLRGIMCNNQPVTRSNQMVEKLQANEARVKLLTAEWTERWRETQKILQEQQTLALRKSGVGVVLDSDQPHLLGIDDSVLGTGVTFYPLQEGRTSIGNESAIERQDIVLEGEGLRSEHCVIELLNGEAVIIPSGRAECYVDSVAIDKPTKLVHGCGLRLGRTNLFRYNDPAVAARMKQEWKRGSMVNLSRLSFLSWSTPDLAKSTENLHFRRDSDDMNGEIKRKLEYQDASDLFFSSGDTHPEVVDEGDENLKREMIERDLEELTEQEQSMKTELEAERLKIEEDRSRLQREFELKLEQLETKRNVLLVQEKELQILTSAQLADLEHKMKMTEQERDSEVKRAEAEAEEVKRLRLELHSFKELITVIGVSKRDGNDKISVGAEALQLIAEDRSKVLKELETIRKETSATRKKLDIVQEDITSRENDIRERLSRENFHDHYEKSKLELELTTLVKRKQEAMEESEGFEVHMKQNERRLIAELDSLSRKESILGDAVLSKPDENHPVIKEVEKELEKKLAAFNEAKEKIGNNDSLMESIEIEKRRSMSTMSEDIQVIQTKKEELEHRKSQEITLKNDEIALLEHRRSSLEIEKNSCLQELRQRKRCLTLELESSSCIPNDLNSDSSSSDLLSSSLLPVSDNYNHPNNNRRTESPSSMMSPPPTPLPPLPPSTPGNSSSSSSSSSEDGDDDASKAGDGMMTTADEDEVSELTTSPPSEYLSLGKTESEASVSPTTTMETTTSPMPHSPSPSTSKAGSPALSQGSDGDDSEVNRLQTYLERLSTDLTQQNQSNRKDVGTRIMELQALEEQYRLVEEELERGRLKLESRSKSSSKLSLNQPQPKMNRLSSYLGDDDRVEISFMDENSSVVSGFSSSPRSSQRTPSPPQSMKSVSEQQLNIPGLEGVSEGVGIAVPSYVIRGSGSNTHVEYEIKVAINGEVWSIFRRYRRIRALHLYMKKKYGSKVSSLRFPSRKFFGSTSESQAEHRRKQLQDYLHDLIKMCLTNKECPLYAVADTITKQYFCEFLPFFRKETFETSKWATG